MILLVAHTPTLKITDVAATFTWVSCYRALLQRCHMNHIAYSFLPGIYFFAASVSGCGLEHRGLGLGAPRNDKRV